MATLTVVTASRSSGVDLVASSVAAAVAGDKFANDGNVLVIFTNTSGAPITVTFPITRTLEGLAIASRTVEIPAASTVSVGPFPAGVYNDTDGLVPMTYSSVVDLYVKVLKTII